MNCNPLLVWQTTHLMVVFIDRLPYKFSRRRQGILWLLEVDLVLGLKIFVKWILLVFIDHLRMLLETSQLDASSRLLSFLCDNPGCLQESTHIEEYVNILLQHALMQGCYQNVTEVKLIMWWMNIQSKLTIKTTLTRKQSGPQLRDLFHTSITSL